jgi:phosphate transport system protein
MDSLRPDFEAQLERLGATVLNMGSLVTGMLHDAMQSLVAQDATLAREVRKRDALANQLDDEIEETSIRLLALQCPVGGDLRRISSALKVITDLERVGDYATDIAKSTLALSDQPFVKPLEDIPLMGRLVEQMIHDALKAWSSRDVVFGKQVRDEDKEIDRVYKRVFEDLMGWLEREPAQARQAAQLLLVARYLERLGDHTKNIIERVAYAETGMRRPWRNAEWRAAHGLPETGEQPPAPNGEQGDHEE